MGEYGKTTYYHEGIIRERKGKFQAEYNYGSRRPKKTYSTIGECKRWIDQQTKMIKALGQKYLSVSVPEMDNAITALTKANGHISLTDAVDYWLLHNQTRTASKTLKEYYDEYYTRLETERNASREYLKETRSRVGNMVSVYADKKLHEVSTDDLKGYLDEKDVQQTTKRKIADIWQTFFNSAIKDKLLVTNPATGLFAHEKGKRQTRLEKLENNKAPEILTPAQVQVLFANLEENNPDFVVPLALSFFAGLRTEEIARMKYEYIHLSAKEIDVKARVAKMCEQRFVKIKPNLETWLGIYGKAKGYVCGDSPTIEAKKHRLERARKKAAKEASVTWVHNAGRHSFGSYHFRAFDNERDTFQQMGHENIGTFRRHYKNTVRHKKDALAYWDIAPAVSMKKTIPLRSKSA